jgi:hypothetical protein
MEDAYGRAGAAVRPSFHPKLLRGLPPPHARLVRPGEAGEAGGLPSAAALSDAVKAANADVEAALRQDRTLQRQRDFDGVVGVFQARPPAACARCTVVCAAPPAECAARARAPGRGRAAVRCERGKAAAPCCHHFGCAALHAQRELSSCSRLSVLTLPSSADAANASFTIWLMAVVSLPQALAVTCSADLVGAVLVFVLLFGRGQDPQRVQHLLNRRRNLLPGSPLTTALERAIQQTLTPCDNELV